MMSKMMSNLMSEFREKIAVDLADLRCCHVGTIRSIDVVCDTAASGMSHHRLTVFFGYAQDVEIGRKRMSESVGRHLIVDAEILAKPLQPFPESFEIEVEHFPGRDLTSSTIFGDTFTQRTARLFLVPSILI